MHVTLDMFSGRPNPEWTLPPGDAAALAGILGGLREEGGPPPPNPEGLGYRGFVVRGVGDALPGCDEVRVKGERLTARCGRAPRVLADPGRAAERWLVEHARDQVEPEVHEALRGETGG